MIQPTILWQGSIDESQLQVTFIEGQESNRSIDPYVEGKLQESWGRKIIEARERDRVLYDGISYRLEALLADDKGLTITVSPMQFSVRSTLKRMPQLEALGEEYYSHGLSIGGFVITSDNQYIFAQKSSRSSSSLRNDLIGGVLEEIEPASGVGVFDMNRTELKEEIHVGSSMIDSMRIIGLVRSSTTDIVIATSTRLRITSAKLRKVFEMREDMELEGLVFVAPENLSEYLHMMGGYKPLMINLIGL